MIQISNIIHDEKHILELTQLASKDNHRNSKNYLDFEKRLDSLIAFHVVYNYDMPVAFAGMFMPSYWPQNHVRILDRCFYFKHARCGGLNFINEKQLKTTASTYFIPEQRKLALEEKLIPFWSIQEIQRRKAMIRQVDRFNEYNKDYEFYVLPGMYQTTKNDTGKESWQSIAILKQHTGHFKLKSKSLSYFIDRKF